MRKISWMAIVTMATASVLASACGGDDDDGPGGSGGSNTGGSDTGGNDSGGSDSGGSGSGGTNTGGTSTGGASTGGTSTGGMGTGGDMTGGTGGMTGGTGGSDGTGAMGGMGGMVDMCETTASVLSPVQVKARDDVNSWGANDFDSVTLSDGECDELIVSADWPHEANYEETHPADANYEATTFELEFVQNGADLTGKQLNLTIALTDDGRGADADNGGYTVYLGATDADGYQESSTPYADSNMPGAPGHFYGAGDPITITHVLPEDEADFDDDNIYKVFVRVQNKIWGDGSGSDADNPQFDYETSVFEITDFTITDAP